MPERVELGVRTVFNLLGPLVNPAGVKYQLIGVYEESLCPKVAEVLANLGCERAMVVHGLDGLDEVSTVGPTRISLLQHGHVSSELRIPAEFSLVPAKLDDIAGGSTAEESATILRSVLTSGRGPRRDITCVNAAAAFIVGGAADTWRDGIALAQSLIDSGRALHMLNAFVEFTQSVGADEHTLGNTRA
jgi:anthranilate phosphoribosyltransferase